MPTFTWQAAIKIPMDLEPEFPESLEDEPGLYMFSRRWGDNAYEPFYIGQSRNLLTRLGQYMRPRQDQERRVNLVITGGQDPKSGFQRQTGKVYFHCGYLGRVSGLNVDKALRRAERALIQFALITGETLMNHNLAGKSALRTFEMKGSLYSGLLKREIVAHR